MRLETENKQRVIKIKCETVFVNTIPLVLVRSDWSASTSPLGGLTKQKVCNNTQKQWKNNLMLRSPRRRVFLHILNLHQKSSNDANVCSQRVSMQMLLAQLQALCIQRAVCMGVASCPNRPVCQLYLGVKVTKCCVYVMLWL